MSVPGAEVDENGAQVEAYSETAPATHTRLRQVTFLQHSGVTSYQPFLNQACAIIDFGR